ncbi:GntR family transcriptional regulator [Streptococcus gallolyticus]|uniref:GntR family transcriptional regulator n=1 Tax=Streptococcus gallolyticus TaxID=315405 RepID=A0A368UBA5_9STRE|nr:GntR family transcriptional regulator [Streptococcus gallolyticus]RCW16281.1 GntR family transcriptional regulator [Streptococcus gallolyticus]
MAKKEPKYSIIQKELLNEIMSGAYTGGEKFYSQAELCTRYQVSSITIIRALKELEKAGYLTRKQGLGTFVAQPQHEKIVKLSTFEALSTKQDAVNVLSIEKGNNPYYLDKLNLHKSEYYYKITRIKYNDSTPYIYHQAYIPHDYILDSHVPLEKFNSIYRRFRHDFNIYLSEALFRETTEVIFPAPETIASQLELPDKEPVIYQLKTMKHSKNGRILEYSETYKHWHFFKTEITHQNF